MGNTLFLRIFLAMAGISVVSIVVAGVILVANRRDQAQSDAVDRLAAAAPIITLQLAGEERPFREPGEAQELVERTASRWGVRVLVTDATRKVLFDSSGSLTNATLSEPVSTQDRQGIFQYWSSNAAAEKGYVFLEMTDANYGPRGRPSFARGLNVIVAGPEGDITGAWRRLVRPLVFGGAGALVVAGLLAAAVGGWIAGPVSRLTTAVHGLARGGDHEPVDIGGPREIQDLGHAFNTMSSEVTRSQRQMRTLVGSASHDLRTPLTSIVGYAQALSDGTVSDPDSTRRAGDVILAESQRMTRLVTDLLYLSQLDARNVALVSTPFDLADLARESAASLPPSAGERGVTFSVEAPDNAPALGDPGATRQVIDKLIDNAARYAEPGSEAIVSVIPARNETRLAVSSVGVPPGGVDRLFERFYRPDPTNGNGTGLGLAISRELVAAMGGEIRAEAAEGRTVVTVTLPA